MVEHAGGTSGPGAVGMGALSYNMVMESGQEGSRAGRSALAEAGRPRGPWQGEGLGAVRPRAFHTKRVRDSEQHLPTFHSVLAGRRQKNTQPHSISLCSRKSDHPTPANKEQ